MLVESGAGGKGTSLSPRSVPWHRVPDVTGHGPQKGLQWDSALPTTKTKPNKNNGGGAETTSRTGHTLGRGPNDAALATP